MHNLSYFIQTGGNALSNTYNYLVYHLFKGVCPIPKGILVKKWDKLNREITRVTCVAQTSDCLNTFQVPASPMPQDQGYFSVELI